MHAGLTRHMRHAFNYMSLTKKKQVPFMEQLVNRDKWQLGGSGLDSCLSGLLTYLFTCHLFDAFIQSDLHTFNTVGSPHRSNFGVKCLAQGHNDMLTAVEMEPALP